MIHRTLILAFLILMFSSATFGMYFVVDYFMDHGWPKIFGQSCNDYIQDDCVYINSHLNTFNDFDYRAHVRCKMTLDAGDQVNATYKIKWLRFKVEASDCSIDHDFLEFHNGNQNYTNATRIGRFCGWTYPYPNLTDLLTQKYLTIVWRTNGALEDKGWRFMATRVLPWPCPSDDYFHCKAENRCMDGRLKCDGIEQCDDGEDESECSTWEKILGGFLALGTAGVTAVSLTCFFFCIWICIGLRCLCKQCQQKPQDQVVQIDVNVAGPDKQPPPDEGTQLKFEPLREKSLHVTSAMSRRSENQWDSPSGTPEPDPKPKTDPFDSNPKPNPEETSGCQENPWDSPPATPAPDPKPESNPNPEAHNKTYNQPLGMLRMLGPLKGTSNNKVLPK